MTYKAEAASASAWHDYRPPLFVVPGMPRAGTTFLYHNLQKHPQIFLPYRKEIDYFNEIYHFRGLDWFLSLYREIRSGQIAGDLSPACWFDPNAIQYIKQYGYGVKVILAIREPAENTYSLYVQKLSSNYDIPKSFQDFMSNGYTSRLTNKGKGVNFVFSNKAYIENIENYKRAFERNLLVYDFRLFRQNNLAVLQAIEDFLGLNQWFTPYNYDARRINESYRRNIKFLNYLSTSESLRDFVEKHVPRLVTMRIRSFIDRISVKTRQKDNTRQTHHEEYINLAKKRFAIADNYYHDLFRDNPIFLGDGSPFKIRNAA
ncbi:MAG: hypothetical protein C4576_20310 [Desulfobacteraceae bacterium]|nr:MAG: hypothetical protein C4576_20310 [Desulfobacteraceae bacterium]